MLQILLRRRHFGAQSQLTMISDCTYSRAVIISIMASQRVDKIFLAVGYVHFIASLEFSTYFGGFKIDFSALKNMNCIEITSYFIFS